MTGKNALATAEAERRIAERINPEATDQLVVSNAAGGLTFANVGQVMEFAKLLAVSSHAVPNHLRGNPGACLGVLVQAIEWEMSPYAVANKSYSVNDRLAYESQLVQAVILRRAPIEGRFKVDYEGQGDKRVCIVKAKLKDSDEWVEYRSPEFGRITPKNSPLWKSDPDQQHFYYSARALCRRHFPDVLLGVYARDEIEDRPGTEGMRAITPPRSLEGRLDALAGNGEKGGSEESVDSRQDPAESADPPHDPDTGELQEDEGDEPSEADQTREVETASPSAGAAASAEPAQDDQPATAEDDAAPTRAEKVHEAYEAGRRARSRGIARKAVPTEYRQKSREEEHDAWVQGWVDEDRGVESA